MPVENPQKDDIAELQDQRVDNKELQDITKKVEDPDFCQNFADQLKTNEDGLVSAITSSVDKCNSDVQIQTLQDFLKSLEDIKGDIPHDFTALKIAIQTKIEEYEKTDENNISTQTFPNPDVLNDLETQVDKIYQENGIEKEDAQKILDYISVNKDNPAFITFMDGLIKKNADGIKITFDKRDGYIGTAEDFAKKIEEIGLPKLDLKPKEKTVDNTNTGTTNTGTTNTGTTNTGTTNTGTTNTGTTNTGTTNTAPTSIDFATEVPKLKQEIEKGLIDGTAFLSFAKDSKTIQDKISSHPRYKEITADVANITDIKDLRNVMIKGAGLVTDVLKDADVKKDIETQLQKTPNNKITFDLIKQDHDYLVSVIQGLDKSIQNMTPQQFEEAIKNNTLGNSSKNKGDIPAKDYNFNLSKEVNNIKTSNESLLKVSKELLTKLASAKTQAEMNTILNDFIQVCDTNDDIKNDKDRSKLKTALEKAQSIPKEDIELVINSIQNGDLDFVTAKIESNKKKTESQEKLDKEKGIKDLSEFLKTSIDANLKTEAIAKLAKPLFETDANRFNALCDRVETNPKDPKQLDQNQQKNLQKYIAAYMGLEETNFTIDGLKLETSQGDGTYAKGIKIIKIDGYTDRHIVFGTFTQVQKDKADHFEKSGGKAKIIEDLTKGKNKEAIIGLADVGSYKVFETIIKDNPLLLQSILKNGFLTQLMDANTLLIKNKTAEPGKTSVEDILKLQLADQQKGYIEVIRDNILNEISTNGNVDPFKRSDPTNKESATEKARISRGLFHEYMAQIKGNPSYLGDDLNNKVGSFNKISTTYINYRNTHQAYFTLLESMSEDEINTNPQKRIDKETREMFSVINKNVGAEVNKEYGMVASLEKLFVEFKDEIVMVLELLGFDKESVLHRCGGNESLKKAINEAYEKAFKLDAKDKDIINNIHTKGEVFNKLQETTKYDPDKSSTQDILTSFRTGKVAIVDEKGTKTNVPTDFKKAYITEFKAIDSAQVDGSFLRSLVDSYNQTQTDAKNKISPDNYITGDNKAKAGWTDILDKARDNKFIWDTIESNSDALAGMALDNKAKRKSADSQFPEAESYTVQQLGANPMEAVSYYLSTMILAGSKDLKYKISENNAAEPVLEKKPETTTATPETPKEKLIKDQTLATEEDGVYTITAEGAKKRIHDLVDTSDKGPKMLVITDKTGKKSFAIKGKDGATDTFVDSQTLKRTVILEGYTIKEASQAEIDSYQGEKNVTETISKVGALDKSTLDATQYQEKVTKPIFDLFTTPNTYNYMHQNDTDDATIKDTKTFDNLMMFSYDKFKPTDNTTPFVHLDIQTVVIKKKDESVDNKITFEVTEKGITTPRVFTIDNTGKFEEIKKDKTSEKIPATIDYTSIDAFRKSLGYTGTEMPKDYDTKLETEFLKDGLTDPQKTVIAKEIARIHIELATKNKLLDINGAKVGTATILDGKVKDGGTLSYDIKKTSDTEVEISINNFKTTAKIEEITKPVA